MCGIVGLFDPDRRFAPHALRDVVGRMRDSLRHRGPDSAGAWFDADAGLALGHRRLAIIDRSESGQQPMLSPSGRYCIVFNGEIYNFLRLRRELVALGAELRGRSDTEVLLAAIDQWGVRPTLGRLVGMFAFALWDRQTGTLTLARDHLGQKPLYFARIGSTFAFASELKAFAAHPDFDPEVDRGALALFLRHQYVPSPHTLWAGVHKLPAGCFLALDLSRGRLPESDLRDRIERHWCARTIAEADRRTDATFANGVALDRLDQLLSQAVGDCMVADVPLGAFLSGGIDSSLVVAMMQKHAVRPVKTFTIGFLESSFDEAADARRVARHLGTEHTELYLPPSEARAIIPQLPEMFDEPFSDPSQIPTFHLARLAKAHVTVSLSGDGADEMFGGYGRYLVAERLCRQSESLPRALRHTAAALGHALPPAAWDLVLRLAHLQAPPGLRGQWSGDRVHKLAALLRIDDPDQLYRAVISAFQDPCAMVIGADEPLTAFTDPDSTPQLAEYTERMMYYDTVTYLPDDILVKLDRASMAVSLEARVPLLDHRLVEFALQLPLEAKLQAGRGKWLLRQLFCRYLPAEFAERPKQGFAVPLADWLRGPLREWAEALLDERRLIAEGFLAAGTVRRKWHEHLSGSRNWSTQLWNLLMFQAWQERWLGAGRTLPLEARAADPVFEEWSSRAEAYGL